MVLRSLGDPLEKEPILANAIDSVVRSPAISPGRAMPGRG